MAKDKLKKVLWRCRQIQKIGDTGKITRHTLDKAVIIECGYSPSTLRNTRKALLKIGWIKHYDKIYMLTGEDISEDYTVY